jgi:hypothetical protein
MLINQGFAQAEFDFEKKVFKFSKTPAGEVLNFEYNFTNVGNIPLIINEIKVTCPCTKYKYPKEPILPKQKGKITVTFDTDKKIGYQDRTINIYSNTKESPYNIRFKGMVDHKHPKK